VLGAVHAKSTVAVALLTVAVKLDGADGDVAATEDAVPEVAEERPAAFCVFTLNEYDAPVPEESPAVAVLTVQVVREVVVHTAAPVAEL